MALTDGIATYPCEQEHLPRAPHSGVGVTGFCKSRGLFPRTDCRKYLSQQLCCTVVTRTLSNVPILFFSLRVVFYAASSYRLLGRL